MLLARIRFTLLAIVVTFNATGQDKPWIWHEHIKGHYSDVQHINSTITGVTYPYHIYLPSSYNNNPNKPYPVMYALDGQWSFRGAATKFDKKSIQAILVAIEQGPDNRRNIDYRVPGIAEYINFFRTEFMPAIEQKYRVDPAQRTMVGTSFGGIASTAFLFTDNHLSPVFNYVVANDPAYWHKPKGLFYLLDNRLKQSPKIDTQFLVTSASQGNVKSVKKFIKAVNKRDIENFELIHQRYSTTHKKIVETSLDDTLERIYDSSLSSEKQ